MGGRGDRDPVPRLQDAARFHDHARARKLPVRGRLLCAAAPAVSAAGIRQPPSTRARRPRTTSTTRRSTGASGRWSTGVVTASQDRDRHHARGVRARDRRLSASCSSSSSRRRIAARTDRGSVVARGRSITATDAEAKRLEKILKADRTSRAMSPTSGGGSPRFYLPLDQQLQQPNFAQFVLSRKSNEVRERLRARLMQLLDNEFTAAARAREPRCRTGRRSAYPGAVPGDPARPRDGARDCAAGAWRSCAPIPTVASTSISTGTSRPR